MLHVCCVAQALGNFALIQDRGVIKEHLMDFSQEQRVGPLANALCVLCIGILLLRI